MFYASMVESERPIIQALERFTVDDLANVSKAAASRILMRDVLSHLGWSDRQIQMKTELASYLLTLLYENLSNTAVRGPALFKKLKDNDKDIVNLYRTLSWGIFRAHSSETALYDNEGNDRTPLDLMFEASANEQVYQLLLELQKQLISFDPKLEQKASRIYRHAS